MVPLHIHITGHSGDGGFSLDQNPVHMYTNVGPYTACLTATDANGCDTTVCMVVTPICNSVGTDEYAIGDIHVYPNPSKDIFNIVLPEDAAIHIYNLAVS